MAHRTQIAWCLKVKEKYPQYFIKKRILEIGSLDINGNNKGLFENCDYIGLDVIKGKNVDVVSIAHEYNSDIPFDVILSTNAFEHDMYFELTLKKMVELLKPSGLMFFSACSNHKVHGTEKTSPWASGTAQINNKKWANYYKHMRIEDITNILNLKEIFSKFSLKDEEKDVRFSGIKKLL